MIEVYAMNRGGDVHRNKTPDQLIILFSEDYWPPTIVGNFLSKGGSASICFFLLHFMFFFSVVKINGVSIAEINSKLFVRSKENIL